MEVTQSLVSDIKLIIASSKDKAIRAVDTERTSMYWEIGRRIFEEEQEGKDRAEYGKNLVKYLSEKLQPEYGSGYSVRQLQWYRQFYRTFPIASALRTQLSWTQYKLLLGVDNQDIGQLQMYVNYYDRTEKMPTENPTIGILLCSDKNDAVVKFTLPEHSKNIIASQYKLYLPTEQQLLEEVNKELSNFINHKEIQPEN